MALFGRRDKTNEQQATEEEVARARYAYVVRTASPGHLVTIHTEALSLMDADTARAWLDQLDPSAAGSLSPEEAQPVIEKATQERTPLTEAATDELLSAVRRSPSVSSAYEGFLDSPEAADLELGPATVKSPHRPSAYYSSAGNFGSRHRPTPKN